MTSASAKAPETTEQAEPGLREAESVTRLAWRRFRRNPLALAGAVILILLLFSAIFANWLAPYDPYDTVFTETLLPPSARHWLGTDHVGRDALSRLLYAGRYSFFIGFAVQGITLLIGLSLGGWAGWKGGRTDYLIMRLVDTMGSFPTLLFQMVLVSVFSTFLPPGATVVILALSLTGWVGTCWLMRSQVLSLREQDYVLAARGIGANDRDIVSRHLVPNALAPIIVSISFGIPGFMAAEAGLSFLGLGISPPTPTWGQMLGEGGKYIQSPSTWYLVIPPAVIFAVVLLSFQFVGEGLQEALNPRLRG